MAGQTLTAMPKDERARELWLQHGAGFILFQDMRHYAIGQIPEDMDAAQRDLVIKGIDDAVYGMMMIFDGVTGSLGNQTQRLTIQGKVVLEDLKTGKAITELAFQDGDGMCVGCQYWRDGLFGKIPPAVGVKPAE